MSQDCALSLLIGVGFGAGIAVLFTPKSGDQTRFLIAKKTRNGTGYLQHQATDFIERSSEAVKRHKDGIRRALEAGRQAYQMSVR